MEFICGGAELTVLNFHLQEDIVCLVTDTIASNSEDMSPVFFTTKVYPTPHWEGLICGTGVSKFIVEWFSEAITSVLAKDIRHLNEFAPSVLRELFVKYQGYGNRDLTSTVYHFGFDHNADRFIGFAYRSTADFVSEELKYGSGIKPHPEDISSLEINAIPADLISIVHAQKLRDDSLPVQERVGIGGHLILYLMQRVERDDGSYSVTTEINRFFEFPDYEEAYLQACLNLSRD